MSRDLQTAVLSTLKNLQGLEPLKQLFWQYLNYDRVNQSLPRRDWGEGARQALAEDPVLFADANGFHILYCRLALAVLQSIQMTPRDNHFKLALINDLLESL